MRLSTDAERDQELADATIAAAAEAGITVFDTARAYGRDEGELGHNERLLAAALRRCGAEGRARIVTKGGMARPLGGWVPDGRAKTIMRDCEASLAALDGLPIALYLLHAPDPRTPWGTSVRTLGRLHGEGVVARIGLSNVNLRLLDEALELAPIAAVEIALSAHDGAALRSGVLERSEELGLAFIAHSPLGGPRRAGALARRRPWLEIAGAHGVAPAEVALAWLLGLSPAVIAIPGARRPETARSAAHAARLSLGAHERAAVAHASGATRPVRRAAPCPRDGAEVVLIMGIPGAGKSRVAEQYVSRGYLRLNRDERGGALREQVNLVERLLERFGTLPSPEDLRAMARGTAGVLTPTSHMRTVRELEPPSLDEGFAGVEVVPFIRAQAAAGAKRGVFVAAAALRGSGWERVVQSGDRGAPHLVFDWSPGGAPDALDSIVARLAAAVAGPVEGVLCPHAAGPPSCWCRPPLPGLPLAFARAHGLEPSRSILIGSGPAHRTLAATLGARLVPV
jgi:aryl-alcohol dehydrogenase-like predicted oxidoreductase